MKKISFLIFTLIASIFTLSSLTSAQENLKVLEVEPIFGEFQDKDIEGYYSMKVKGNSKKDTLKLRLKNNDKETKKLLVEVLDAYTSPNGVVQYATEDTEDSKFVDEHYRLTKHLKIKGSNVIELKSGEETLITAELNANDIEGTLLGGIGVQYYDEDEEIENSSFTIKNKVRMITGFIAEFDNPQELNLVIGQAYVKPMPSYYTLKIPVSLESPFYRKLNVEYRVIMEGNKIFEGSKIFDFAPETTTNITLPWEYETIKQNSTYVVEGVIKYKGKDGVTESSEDFEINFEYNPDKDENPDDNSVGTSDLKKPTEENGENSNKIIFILIFLGLIGLLLLVLALLRSKKYKLENVAGEYPNEINSENALYPRLVKLTRENKKGTYGVYKLKKDKEGRPYYIYATEVVDK